MLYVGTTCVGNTFIIDWVVPNCFVVKRGSLSDDFGHLYTYQGDNDHLKMDQYKTVFEYFIIRMFFMVNVRAVNAIEHSFHPLLFLFEKVSR